MSGADLEAIATMATELKRAARAARQRRMLLCSGSADWCRRVARAAVPAPETLWLSDAAPAGVRCLPLDQARSLLGRDVTDLVIDAHCGFDPDAFGAASGSLCGGGLLLLLTPPLDDWPRRPDPQNARIAVPPYAPEQLTGRFLQRLARILAASDELLHLAQGAPLPPLPGVASAPPAPVPPAPYGSLDQRAAVAAIRHAARGHRHRPLVISADRGRGKSSACGLAAAQLLLEGTRSILVTAPRPAAVDTLFDQARRHLPGAKTAPGRLAWNGGELRFVATDELLRSSPPAELLLVDEAAGIPLALLEALLPMYAHMVLASTVHGYEGTGRGFALKFRTVLDRLTPGWQALEMRTPIRWAAEDPLERLVYRALLLDAGQPEAVVTADRDPADCRFARIDRDALLADEAGLSRLFGLLVQSHYRTRPFDLRHLLDGPNLEVYGLHGGDDLAAVALLAREGGLDATLAQAVFEGRRRVQGHLLPQTLVANLGLEGVAGMRYGRIMRIAVHPLQQGRGLGTSLLTELETAARAAGLDWLGTSFGMTPALLDFWQGNGYRPVRLGMRREASSGACSVLLLRPLSRAAAVKMSEAQARYCEQLAWQLADTHRDLSPALVARLWDAAVAEPPAAAPATDWREIQAFAFALRGFEDSAPALERLLRARLARARSELDPLQVELLVRRLLEHQDWAAIVQALGLAGKAEALARARVAVGELLRLEAQTH